MQKQRILFLSNHFITLYSFRKELIKQLIDDGHDVFLSMPKDDENSYFADLGCKIIDTPMARRGMNPILDIKLIVTYRNIMKSIKPDVIFSYTIKPNIYGCIASNSLHYRQVCNITGTGATFLRESFLSKIVRTLYRVSVKKAHKVFFQNTGDCDYFVRHKLVRENYDMIPGSGVNLDQYSLTELPMDETTNFIFIGRVMGVKGIDQYLACAKELRAKYPNTCFYIAGFIEEEQYKAIIEEYHAKGIVNYIGFQKNIIDWIQKCHCTVLPSLGGEGIPNVLLESAAMGRACIASRINGSIDVVEDGVTGYLFEAGNSSSLIEKVERYLKLSFEEKINMGQAGHIKVNCEYDRHHVTDKYIKEI